MVDRIDRQRRSANMAAIRGRDTGPELVVRGILRDLGVRYRLHDCRLPGRPDIVMRARSKVILVHGCFWHRHARCKFAYNPKSRVEFWNAKFLATISRDARNLKDLKAAGWHVLILWECEISDAKLLRRRIASFLRQKSDAKGAAAETRSPRSRAKTQAGRRR